MKKRISIVIIAIMLLLTGCTTTNNETKTNTFNYTFKGENESWVAEYIVNETETFTEKDGKTNYDNHGDNVLTVIYKNDISELSSVKHMEISFKSISSSVSLVTDFNDASPNEKTFILKSGFENGALTIKNQVITVTVNLDGKIQTFELTNVD